MKKLPLLLLACSLVLFVNCKTKNKAQKTATETPQSTMNGEQKTTYRLVISFTSHASGIDAPKYETIENYIKSHAKKPAYDVMNMGREGEKDICLQLKELTKSEQISFIDEVKKLAQGSDRVNITENAERVKKQ